MELIFIAAYFITGKIWNHPRSQSTDKYHSIIQNNEIMSLATKWLQLEAIMLGQMRQTLRDENHVSPFCGRKFGIQNCIKMKLVLYDLIILGGEGLCISQRNSLFRYFIIKHHV